MQVFVCLPKDTSTLPDIGVPVPTPSIQHTLKQCQTCGQDIWVGPNQLQQIKYAQDAEDPHSIVCYLCGLQVMKDLEAGTRIELSVLNPNESRISRRI